MARKIIVHAGWPKTGTSSLQNVLFENREALLDHDRILYPSIGAFQSRMLVTMFRDNAADQAINKIQGVSEPDEIKKMAAEYGRAYEEEINGTDWDTLIISAEGLSNFTQEELKRFKTWIDNFSLDQTVYFLVRQPAKYSASAIQQFLKTGRVLDILYEHIPKSILPNYFERISRFIDVFGEDSIRVNTFEDAVKHEGGPTGYFVNAWGISEHMGAHLVSEARHDNTSLSTLAAHILSSLNRQRPVFVEGDKPVERTANELNFLKNRFPGEKFKLPRDVVERINDITHSDVQWLYDKYGLMFPEYEKSGTADDTSFADITAREREIIDAVALTISDLLNERYYLKAMAHVAFLRREGKFAQAEKVQNEAKRVFPQGK